MKKQIGLSSIGFLVGSMTTLYVVNPNMEKKQVQQKDQQIVGLKKEMAEKNLMDETGEQAVKSHDDSLPKDTHMNYELDAIKTVAAEFLSIYYHTTVENVTENLKQMERLLAEDSSEKYRPGWLSQHEENILTQKVISEKYYTNFKSINGQATVIAFLRLQTKIGESGKVFPAQFLNRIELKKNENNSWQVIDFNSTATNDSFLKVEDFYT